MCLPVQLRLVSRSYVLIPLENLITSAFSVLGKSLGSSVGCDHLARARYAPWTSSGLRSRRIVACRHRNRTRAGWRRQRCRQRRYERSICVREHTSSFLWMLLQQLREFVLNAQNRLRHQQIPWSRWCSTIEPYVNRNSACKKVISAGPVCSLKFQCGLEVSSLCLWHAIHWSFLLQTGWIWRWRGTGRHSSSVQDWSSCGYGC